MSKALGRARLSVAVLLALGALAPLAQAAPTPDHGAFVLHPETYQHYIDTFRNQEKMATGKEGENSWPWMLQNIPWFEASNPDFQEMYYFRWYALQKHIVHTPDGLALSEFLTSYHIGGKYGTRPDAAGHQMREARWLRNPELAEDYARYWMSPGQNPREYSDWMAASIRSIELVTGDDSLGNELLPALVKNYEAWVETHQDPNGLFWSIDTRDAMEKSISGSGYRPTLNSYMYGDAVAISAMAKDAGKPALEGEFAEKAAAQRERIEKYLWNPKAEFYEVRAPRGPHSEFANVRELIGYIPWYFHIPAADHAVAWKQLFDPKGFLGKYGPTTAERRSPRFRFPNSDKCQWNGPSWPFATTQTLVAMANLINDQPHQRYATRQGYYRLFTEYVRGQHLTLGNGQVIPWIDEDLDADTDEWIARDIMIKRNHPEKGRGSYYDHSGFADPLISGLIGLRPSEGNRVVIHPLLPAGKWSYFALDGVPYHGHLLTILYDKTGRRYHEGRGFILLVDGRKAASRSTLGTLTATLPGRR